MRRAMPVGVVVVVLLAGCLGGPGAGTTEMATPSSTAPSLGPAYEAHVFDSSPHQTAPVEGGLDAPAGGTDPSSGRTDVTTIGTESEAGWRFNRSLLPTDAADFVDETDFGDAFLVVVQTYPASSVPDAKVEAVSRDGGTLSLTLDDSSDHGTDDLTVEPLLIRKAGPVPGSVRLTDEADRTVAGTDGAGRPTTGEPNASTGVALRYRADEPAPNLDDARSLILDNRGETTIGYRVEVKYLDDPDCRAETPACAMPSRELPVLGDTGKVRPGGGVTVGDLAARRGHYTISVVAEVPAGNGSRRTVRGSAHWELDAGAPDAHVVLADDAVLFLTPTAPEDGGRDGETASAASSSTPRVVSSS